MSELAKVLTIEELELAFPDARSAGAGIALEGATVPTPLRPLLPYAEIWGVADDVTRDLLVRRTPDSLRAHLKAVLAAFDDALDEWLSGPEADLAQPSAEYLAYSALRMAADFA